MKNKVLKFYLLNKKAIIPKYDYPDDAAFGIYSVEEKILKPKEIHAFSTGIASEFPKKYFVSIRDRSSMGMKGLHVLGGVVDAGYRGEWKIILINLNSKKYKIAAGDKIAQGILHEAVHATIKKSRNLSQTSRGEKGFGSTGK